jgi:hypothetical protein
MWDKINMGATGKKPGMGTHGNSRNNIRNNTQQQNGIKSILF